MSTKTVNLKCFMCTHGIKPKNKKLSKKIIEAHYEKCFRKRLELERRTVYGPALHNSQGGVGEEEEEDDSNVPEDEGGIDMDFEWEEPEMSVETPHPELVAPETSVPIEEESMNIDTLEPTEDDLVAYGDRNDDEEPEEEGQGDPVDNAERGSPMPVRNEHGPVQTGFEQVQAYDEDIADFLDAHAFAMGNGVSQNVFDGLMQRVNKHFKKSDKPFMSSYLCRKALMEHYPVKREVYDVCETGCKLYHPEDSSIELTLTRSSTKATNAPSTSSADSSTISTNSSSTVSESVETIPLDEAKNLIRENYVSNSSSNHSSLQKAFFDFKLGTFNSINNSKLLSYESNLQQILALSNILIVRKNAYDTELDNYFKTISIGSIRKNLLDSLNFKFADKKVPKDIIINLIDIANDLSNGVLTKIDALKKVISTLTKDMDPILVKLLLCFKALIETLPRNTQLKKVKEHELCTRYLQPFFQSLFDSNDDDNMLFKWTNTITFSCNSNEDQSAVTKNRPDGCIENDSNTIGYVEVKTVDYATNHHKINVDLHRLGIFGKTALSKYSLNKTFQVMAIGTNLQFYVCQNVDGVCIMTELNNLRLPVSLGELPQLVSYFDRLYHVVDTVYKNCYSTDNMSTTTTTTDANSNSDTLEPKILKAITEKRVDRTRHNCFYHPSH